MKLPPSVHEFVERQTAVPVDSIWKVDPATLFSPYGAWWYRAIACLLLSGRIGPKYATSPSKTDVNRVCKEANFNQYLTERIGSFLVAGEVVGLERYLRYQEGPRLTAFWERDAEGLKEMSRAAVPRLMGTAGGWRRERAAKAAPASMIELLTMFFAAFEGLALKETALAAVLQDFAALPEAELKRFAQALGLKTKGAPWSVWSDALNQKGERSLLDTLYTAEWAYYVEEKKTAWVFASPTGLEMLGLGKSLPMPELATTFTASSNNHVYAGAGLPVAKLLPLFRWCVIAKLEQVCDFEISRRRFGDAPAGTSPGEELRAALAELEPLPETIADLLQTESKVGGTVRIRWCSALVKPENAEVLAAIRGHPQLKGYLEPGAPPGYLIIKPASRPDNFVHRCQQLGFKVERL
jgi:hypothetical protein